MAYEPLLEYLGKPVGRGVASAMLSRTTSAMLSRTTSAMLSRATSTMLSRAVRGALRC